MENLSGTQLHYLFSQLYTQEILQYSMTSGYTNSNKRLTYTAPS